VKLVNGTIKVYDGASGRFVTTLTSGATGFQVNGNLVSVSKADGRVVVYDAIAGRVITTL
jgi:hypothetical protein